MLVPHQIEDEDKEIIGQNHCKLFLHYMKNAV